MKSFYKKDVFLFWHFLLWVGVKGYFGNAQVDNVHSKGTSLIFPYCLDSHFRIAFYGWSWQTLQLCWCLCHSCCCCHCCLCRWPWWLMGLAWWSPCCPGWPERRGVISQVARQLPVHLATDGFALPTPPASLYFLANQFVRFSYNTFISSDRVGAKWFNKSYSLPDPVKVKV